MPSYDQTPGTLNLAFRRGDTVSSLIDFSVDLSGYSATATLVSPVTGSTVTAFALTFPSASEGQVNIALTDTQTTALARGTYSWQLTWNDGQAARTALTGFVEVT